MCRPRWPSPISALPPVEVWCEQASVNALRLRGRSVHGTCGVGHAEVLHRPARLAPRAVRVA